MAYSAGFSPHPKVSYAGAAPMGVASEAEYVEILLTERCDVDDIKRRIDAALPSGLDIVEVVEAGAGSLADRLEASVWHAHVYGVPPADLDRAIEQFLAADSVEVERLTKQGRRTIDARSAVVTLRRVGGSATPKPAGLPVAGEACEILVMVVRHVTPAVRPDDVLAGLRNVANFAPPSPPLLIRLAQGPLDAEIGMVSDPLAPDRVAASAADEGVAIRSGLGAE